MLAGHAYHRACLLRWLRSSQDCRACAIEHAGTAKPSAWWFEGDMAP